MEVLAPQREERDEVFTHAPLREAGVAVGNQREPAQGAAELHLIQPPVEAPLVEHVAAPQPAHPLPLPQLRQTNHAVRTGRLLAVAAVVVGEDPVRVLLLAEDDQAGQLRGHPV